MPHRRLPSGKDVRRSPVSYTHLVEKVRVDLELQGAYLRFLFLLLFLVIVGDGHFQAVEHIVVALVEDGDFVSRDGAAFLGRREAILDVYKRQD